MAGKTEYKNKYAAENYDRVGLMLKKGSKDKILEVAKTKGEKGESINSYIKRAIQAQYQEDTGENIDL